jgi:quercetin 2,3-dioxygenase
MGPGRSVLGPISRPTSENAIMLRSLRPGASRVFRHGPFRIRRIRPGAILGPGADPAFGPLSVIDHADLEVGTVVSRHEHNNDEILSDMWRGVMVHEDSAGHRIPISPKKLMMMFSIRYN